MLEREFRSFVEGDPPLTVLALNSGSSSLKFGLYRVDARQSRLVISGEARRLGQANSSFQVNDSHGRILLAETGPLASQGDAVVRIASFLKASNGPAPQAIGHRVVHGGPRLREHCRVDETVLRELDAVSAFAPLHTPLVMAVMRQSALLFPQLPQVACFDTSFHVHMPDLARVLPLPASVRGLGIQRYGFHGLSCESIVRQLGPDLPRRLVIAHLGNGASVTAVLDGMSIDTSMGFTPSGGLIMGTRSGDLDPGVLVYLAREQRFDAALLEELVDHQGGLLGISGLSGDMRVLHEAEGSTADARLAVEMFCYAVRKQIAAMSVVLEGAELIVFTGGIGENDDAVRAEVCGGLSTLGVSPGDSGARCKVLVLPSLEDEQIACHVQAVLTGAP